ncbi:TrbC/VirB2 family protein [Pseudoduganella chitinolytica]|uniref:TrbC/VirB2 family protein n=1 Tax=Pseudoduganella chitinolytica TaxID=34070 RepID=A0ABY8B6B0_9BURK|nr:TrbC/VirB2 family protein [Pseudoduganella chitinolytica]WEF31469.1 TrbC/VirB2 family protein [Pseudoduganella chitinolytica]
MTKKISGLIGKGRTALAANKAAMRDADRRASRSMAVMAICAAAVVPGIALAAAAATPWDTMGTQVLAIFQSGLTRTIAIISVIACGIAALAGKLSWDWAIKIIVGIVLIFGGAALVDFLIDAAS